jgi:hypothetical protein
MAVQQQYEPVTDTRALSESLRQVAGRLRWMRWVRMASLGAFIGVCVSIVCVALAIFDLLPDWMMLEVVIPLAILTGAAIGSAFAFRRPVSLMDAARLTESRLGLKERLSSALEFESYGRNPRDPIPSLLIDLQQRDAMRYASAVRPKDALPFRWPWQLKALIAATVVLVLALIIPNLPIFVPPGVQLERAIVAKEGDKLATTARLIEQLANAQQLPNTKWTAQQMRRLGAQMGHGHMDKRQAFVRYAKLTQQMKDLQRQMQAVGAGQGGKSLAAAGQQLADALRASTPSAQNPNSSQSGAQGRGSGNGPANTPGKAGGKSGPQHGFTVPSFNKSGAAGQSQPGAHPTSEIAQAARAMQQGNAQRLSQQLRQLADRVQSGKMSPADQQQAQQDLQKLSDALKGTPMPETQRHSQAAADAMKQGDTQKAASEMRKAADAADREMKNQQDRSAMQNAQQSLQQSQSEMAGASSPADVGQQQGGQDGQGDASGNGGGGQGDSSGQDQSPGQGDQQSAMNEMKRQGQGGGQGNNGKDGNGGNEEGGGSGAANRAGHNFGHSSSKGSNTWHKFQGPANKLNPNFDPSKFPRYAKVYLGKPQGGNASGHLGATLKTRPGAGAHPNTASSVPYYNYVGGARRVAEHAVDSEDIPPAYKQSIQKYFDSLTPPPQQ